MSEGFSLAQSQTGLLISSQCLEQCDVIGISPKIQDGIGCVKEFHWLKARQSRKLAF